MDNGKVSFLTVYTGGEFEPVEWGGVFEHELSSLPAEYMCFIF